LPAPQAALEAAGLPVAVLLDHVERAGVADPVEVKYKDYCIIRRMLCY